LNSLSKLREKDAKETRAIQTITLNSVIENSKFKNKKINLLSIDVEGYEHQVLKSIDLKKYSPEMIIVEYLDREIINNFKFYNQNINHILSSEIHHLLIKNDYSLINLIHSDLIYIHSSAKK
jgi:CYTH domain-containing protein